LKVESILDVPIGTGRFLEYYGTSNVAGLDLSKAMLAEASSRAQALHLPDIDLREGNVTDLPFGDATFDLVVCWRLLHLLPPNMLNLALSEMTRVCCGVLCVQAYERAAWPQRSAARAKRWLRRLGLIGTPRR